jgi:predicted dehydrogenase
MMTKPLNIGVVGLGYWGPNLARNFNALPNCILKTVCDLSEDRLKHITSLYPQAKGESDFDNLL